MSWRLAVQDTFCLLTSAKCPEIRASNPLEYAEDAEPGPLASSWLARGLTLVLALMLALVF